MPGAVDSDGGIIYGSSAIDYIHGPNIKEDLKHRLNKDVEFEKMLTVSPCRSMERCCMS